MKFSAPQHELTQEIIKEDPAAFRELLVEEDDVTPEVAAEMQQAGNIGNVDLSQHGGLGAGPQIKQSSSLRQE